MVSTEEADKFAKEHNMLFLETSAINSKNVENVKRINSQLSLKIFRVGVY